MYNPRWPHTLRAFRAALDDNGLPLTDENGDAVYLSIPLDKVVYDGGWNPKRSADGGFRTETVLEMPWGYRTSTGGIKDSGDVFKADYKISCPMFLTHLEEGVILRLTDSTHTFNGVVKKMTTYNWGTNIWLDNPGNDAEV